MALIPLVAQTYGRNDNLPRSRLVNLYAEMTPNGPAESVRRGRPGLKPLQLLGGGRIRAVVTHLGVRYAVAGTTVYRAGVAIGNIAGSGLVRWARSDEHLVMVAKGKAYVVGADFVQITDPDLPEVIDVRVAGGRFIFAEKDSGRFLWSAVSDPTNIDGLAFATAEGAPDNIVSIETLGDAILFFGSISTEWWGLTTNIDLPFARSSGRLYDKGTASRDTVVKLDNGVYWIGTSTEGEGDEQSDLQVYRTAAVPERVSTNAIEAALALCADIASATAFTAVSGGHTFYVINLPGVGSFSYDVGADLWAEWGSHDRETFRVTCSDGGVYGDAASGQLWTLDADRLTDGDDPITFLVSSYVPLKEGVGRCNCIVLHAARGNGGPATETYVEMRYADAEASGWTEWRRSSLGATGEHRKAVWRNLGKIQSPGRAFEFRSVGRFLPYGVALNPVRP